MPEDVRARQWFKHEMRDHTRRESFRLYRAEIGYALEDLWDAIRKNPFAIRRYSHLTQVSNETEADCGVGFMFCEDSYPLTFKMDNAAGVTPETERGTAGNTDPAGEDPSSNPGQ